MSTDIAKALKKSCFVLEDRSDFNMIDNLSIPFHAFAGYILTYILVDELCCRGM